MIKAPQKVPVKGFYYHYKHDTSGTINNYAYEVVGVGCHTEENDTFMVIYRPLYESSVYTAGKLCDLRPLGMFMEDVTKDGKTFPRFKLITDETVLSQLEKIKNQMYNTGNTTIRQGVFLV
ncbi:MAG: DUF1653 domain-containing protein [Candidatus Pacebacteria bacterium]|nr:DUF1653 domain-containing protein [Candidatus Paceibacterota bacterium]